MHVKSCLYFVLNLYKNKVNEQKQINSITYISVPLGNKVPNSLIRSLILNLRRRSTATTTTSLKSLTFFFRSTYSYCDYLFSVDHVWQVSFHRQLMASRFSLLHLEYSSDMMMNVDYYYQGHLLIMMKIKKLNSYDHQQVLLIT